MIDELNFAYGAPGSTGQIKSQPDDFCVVENLGFELTGEGEHLFLLIEKKGLNTEEMVKIIAETVKRPLNTISYAGLKDKFAKTTQWFSLHLPGMVDPNLEGLQGAQHQVLKAMRHNKKLKIGALKENHFAIRVNRLMGDEQELLERIERIKAAGVPNYFGPQRFGNQGRNLACAKDVLLANKKIKNRHLRGLYYSAARAFLFNQILNHRVKDGSWNRPVPGDLLMLAKSNSVFQITEVEDDILQRVQALDLFPTAELWGRGKELLTLDALTKQSEALEPWQDWCEALERHGLERHHRSMMLVPENLQFNDNVFCFSLPKGTYATTVLRELFVMD